MSFPNQPIRPTSISFLQVFFEDLNFDGVKDLVVCPAFEENYEYKIDFAHSNRLYLNTATDQSPSFSFSQDDFIQSMTMDFGEYSVPVLTDLDADGLSDLLVSANGYWNGEFFNGYITALRNTGSAGEPSFTITDEDYLDLSTLKLVNPVIGLADMNGDDAPDLLYWAVNTTSNKPECRIILNTAEANKPVQFDPDNLIPLPIPSSAEMGDSPCFYDVDEDGFTDLLLGKKNGAMEYYRNNGSNVFILEDAAYLDIERDFQQYRLNLVASVSDIDGNTTPDLLVTDARGMARVYFDFQSQPENGAESINIVLKNPDNNKEDTVRVDSKTWISGADLFGLGSSSLIVGGARGGLQFFKNPAEGIGENESKIVLRMYPNPVYGSNGITFRADRDLQANLLTILGQQVLSPFTINKYQDTFLETATLGNGIYILSVNDNSGNRTAQLLMIMN
ncbi:MAG: T9SS type A sorting domain-containing protein [Cyclobacteriaceae bacterium]|nr:T9SS type A sorting domain-containing protein [Cyclobacteriaceae bacterium]